MSILRSMNTGASGLRAHGSAISVTSDNVANVSTVGYKRQRGVFSDVLGRSIDESVGAVPQSGAGSRLSHIQQMWAQGALLTTDNPTDLALSGNGFFVVNGSSGGIDGNFYTRAGQFELDNEGLLVNTDGLRLQGYMANPDGTIAAELTNLDMAGESIPATATTTADIAMQLDANESVIALAFDPSDPNTYNESVGLTTYDSLGNAHDTTIYFRKTGAGAWEWHAGVDGGEIVGGTAGTPFIGATGTLTFTTEGALDTETPGASSFDFINATAGQSIAFDFGDAITTDGGSGLEGSTGFAAESNVTGLGQNGFASGTVAGLSIDGDGMITGVFTNGQRRTLGRVAVADFTAVDGLQRMGGNLWTETLESGEALVGGAGTGSRGSIVSGALEQSNVDLGQEFVDLIAFQRGFQANSRVITTADEMYGELVNLKR